MTRKRQPQQQKKKRASRPSRVVSAALRKMSQRALGKKATRLIEEFADPVIAPVIARTGRAMRALTGTVKMSKCSAKFALALTRPFHPACQNVCVPKGSIPTHKYSMIQTASVTIGTAGHGFVCIAPTAFSDSGCPNGWFTTANYTLTNLTLYSAINTLQTGVGLLTNSGPYSVASCNIDGTSTEFHTFARVVSCGLRITYTGTTMNMSGGYYALAAPQHLNCTGFNTPNLMAEPGGIFRACSREPFEICCGPTASEAETSCSSDPSSDLAGVCYPYSPSAQFFTDASQTNNFTAVATNGQIGVPVMYVIFTGVAGSTYQVDIVTHCEAFGRLAKPSSTLNESDISGATAVLSALAGMGMEQRADPSRDNYSLLMDGLSSTASAMAPMVLPRSAEALGRSLL